MPTNAYAISADSTLRAARRGRPTLAATEAHEAAIRQAALTVFAMKGFEGSSIVEIAKAAGVTRKTLYARYPNKTELLRAVVLGMIDDQLSLHALADATSAEEALLEIAADITVRSPSAPLVMRIIIAEGANLSHADGPLRSAGRAHLLGQIGQIISALIARNLLPQTDTEAAAELFTDMVIGSAILSLMTSAPDGTVETLLTSRVRLFCAGLRHLHE